MNYLRFLVAFFWLAILFPVYFGLRWSADALGNLLDVLLDFTLPTK